MHDTQSMGRCGAVRPFTAQAAENDAEPVPITNFMDAQVQSAASAF